MLAPGKPGLSAAALIALMASVASAAPMIIDDFNSGSLSDAIFGYTSRTKDEAAAGIIDGWRQMSIAGLGAGGGGSVSYGIAQGRIGLYTGTIAPTYTGGWELLYGPHNDIRMVKDLIGGGNTGIVIDMISAEYAFTLSVRAVVAPLIAPYKYATLPQTAYPANSQPHSLFLPFSTFALDPGFSWTEVDYPTFTFRGEADGDYVIDEIRADVPEPASAALLLVAGLALIRQRKSR